MSYRIRPEEHELRKARETVEKILEGCKHELEKNKVLEVNLGVAPSGSTGGHGAKGVAANSETAQIYFDPEKENWESDLEKVVRKEFGKSWFYEQMEMSGLVWQELLAETFGLMFLSQVEDRKVEKTVEDEWSEKKDKLKKHISPEVQEDFSWQLKWLLGKELLTKYELTELPSLKRSDLESCGESLE
jgi:hypothetical protein